MQPFQPKIDELLLLVPTQGELSAILAAREIALLVERGLRVCACGFGLVASGLVTARELSRLKPKGVILVGIAGALQPRAGTGQAIEFSAVAVHGIGAGSGAGFQSATKMGWEPFPEPELGIGEVIETGWPDQPAISTSLLLSVCSASANDADRESKTGMFPDAVAEDMEGYAVAAACRLAGVPVRIVRGISNLAGNRNHSTWTTAEALSSASAMVAAIIHPSTEP